MNRRSFLKFLTGGAAGFALDPERLLWVPGQRTYFDMPLPPRQIAGVQCFISTDEIVAVFKHVYSAERLAQLARQETVLWNVLSR